ncbi:hypothetical protein B7486_78365, partial [cyanobacterium TDX16]
IRGGAAKATAAAASRGRRLGRVSGCTATADGTEVSVAHTDGRTVLVHLAERVDDPAARRVAASFRRISWASLELHDDGPRATVHGLRHRLPVTVRVPVDVVLSLSRMGVPIVVVAV